MTHYEDSSPYGCPASSSGPGVSPRAVVALIASGLAGLTFGFFAYLSGFGLFWAAVVYFISGQVIFGLCCLRFLRIYPVGQSQRQQDEIDSDLCAFNQSQRNVSLL
ncbi:hypothetical protein [Pseudogemmobacter faecipullorum]|uniref:Uncharacterized protein n=1 Tax=Pseudogemmobacter faecipullorum TaxID=2755041 RepID=A0ABS8CHA8_9RHOB|nr:hypothetical protein [Pseudogemmobacter faecipullorum]MCB5408746.1 hypothetical protein [Pseudogemmobacter faecipullorum]